MSHHAILDRLAPYGLKQTGSDRYRAICPVCGERNASTLSVGITTEGAVLLRCFKSGCTVDTITAALGLEVADLFPPRESYAGPLKRRRMLTDRQALDLLSSEIQLTAIVACDMSKGMAPSEETKARLLTATSRVLWLRDEARS